mmetsp:Transcript_20842/g.65143  ORF Transcript_20842/g.65143 Transcript_20842/m.65143 type:complete len:293 (-) Transcript_20842:169-1047(-)
MASSSSSSKAEPDQQGAWQHQRPHLANQGAGLNQPSGEMTTESLPDLVVSHFSQEDILRYTLRVQQHYKVPVGFLALMAGNGMYLKGRVGVDTRFVPLPSICNPGPSRGLPIIITDTWRIGFFIKDPLVERHPFAKFFAAAPVVLPGHRCVGTLCIMDSQPREQFTLENCQFLVDCAWQVSVLLTTQLDSLLCATVESLESLRPSSQEETSQGSSDDRGKTSDSLPSIPSLSHEDQPRTFDSLPARSHDSLPGMHTAITCDNLGNIPEVPEFSSEASNSPRGATSDMDGGTQ